MKLNSAQYAAAVAMGLSANYHGTDSNPFSSFGEACYNDNSFDDIKGFTSNNPDQTDMDTWEINENEWRRGQQQAIETAMAEYEAANN